uniref:RxLR effector protein n=1 Tax=Phytophthora lateralis TaxID=129355 RepID=C0J5E9_9STRA|nr:putative effector protein Avh120 [Phytophthora lateralis]QTJ63930.1 putative effector protein Avh120 [Phytophthora lateralis]
MRLSLFLLLVILAFVACCSTIVAADEAVQTSNLVPDSKNLASESHRNLKGSKTTTTTGTEREERVGATTPNFGMLWGLLRLPKLQGLARLPLIKQLTQISQKFGKYAGAVFQWLVRKFRDYNNNANM